MSPNTSILAEPVGEERISDRTLGYVSESARDDMFDMVLRNCVESGVTKATLARRLGKDPAQVTRLLGAPGNWTIDTVAELLFAIDGRILKVDSCWPMREPISNQRHSLWMDERPTTGTYGVVAFTDAKTTSTLATSTLKFSFFCTPREHLHENS